MPEVSLVVILEGDKEGFLRSERSLIQIIDPRIVITTAGYFVWR